MDSATGPTAPKRRILRRRGIIAVVVALVVILGGGYLYAGSLIYDDLSVAAPSCGGRFADNTPAAFTAEGVDTDGYAMPAYREVTFPSRDPGIVISAWYVPADRGSAGPAVVIVHGIDSCKREGELLLAAGMLHRAGISALLVDLRNHGDSTVVNGRYAGGTREYRDVLAGWDWLVDGQGFAPDRVGLLGMSLGAATAMIAIGEEPRVAAIWEDSSYADLDAAVEAELVRNGYPGFFRFGCYLVARVRSGDDLLGLSPLKAASKLEGRPIFITHGSADTRLSPSYAVELARAVRADGGTVEPWIIDGAEHTQGILLQPGEYERRLDAFFAIALEHDPS